jgi:hypothetical protein
MIRPQLQIAEAQAKNKKPKYQSEAQLVIPANQIHQTITSHPSTTPTAK